MTIDIRVTKSAATLSCMHKGQIMTKKVQAMYLESFEVVGYYYKEDMDPDSVWKHEAKYFGSLFPNVTESLSTYGFYND